MNDYELCNKAVCCTDVLTESKFANTALFNTLVAATALSAKLLTIFP